MSFGTGDQPTADTSTPVTDPVVETQAPETTGLPADVQKRMEHQAAHIKTLEAEAKERDEKLIKVLESQAEKQTTETNKQDFIDLVESLRSTKAKDPVEETSPRPEISIDEITNAVGDKLKESQLKAKQTENLDSCLDKAKVAYGDDFNKVVMEKAAAKGMSSASLNDLAQNNPLVFAELFLPAAAPVSPDLSSSGDQGAGLGAAAGDKPPSWSGLTSKQRADRVQQLMKAAEGI